MITGLHHLTFTVRNLKGSLAFSPEAVGLNGRGTTIVQATHSETNSSCGNRVIWFKDDRRLKD